MKAFFFPSIFTLLILSIRPAIFYNKHELRLQLPVMLSFSKSVPDSIRDFVKIYLKTRQVRVINLEEAMDLMLEQDKNTLLKNAPTENDTKEEFINKMEVARKPVYNVLRTEMYSKNDVKGLLIDSIKWYVLQRVSQDTTKIWQTFIPIDSTKNCMLIWKDFTDNVLSSGLLK